LEKVLTSSRDEAVRVGAEALRPANPEDASEAVLLEDAETVLDAAHKAGLISYQDEWEQVGYRDLLGRFWRHSASAMDDEPVFRRVSFEAGEEVNEEQT
jgi:hypothetical protein